MKLHFLSSPMFLFSTSACCLPSFSQRVSRRVASWQAAFSELLSCHIAAYYLSTMREDGGPKEIAIELEKCSKFDANSKESKEAI